MLDYIQEIKKLKKEKNAVILAHNYQIPEIQDIADFVGDSLQLSRQAAKTKADIIVFCGVHFMAETAAILSPDKKVLIPDINAGCPLADSITFQQLKEYKEKYPDAPVVSYINTTAKIKTLTDIVCTSSNAVNVVNSLKEDKIIFLPDKNLGWYVSKKVKNKKLIIHKGFCLVHEIITEKHIKEAKAKYPDALVLAHPECRKEVLQLADHIASTSGMLKYAKESEKKEFIIATEVGILHTLKKQNPDKKFYPAFKQAICQNMKKITIEKLYNSLKNEEFEVKISEELRKKAYAPIKRMLEL